MLIGVRLMTPNIEGMIGRDSCMASTALQHCDCSVECTGWVLHTERACCAVSCCWLEGDVGPFCKDCSSVHHLSSRSLRSRFAAGLSLTAKAGSCARSCFADGTIQASAPLPWSCRSAMTGLCMRQGHFQAQRHFQGAGQRHACL